MWKCGLAILRHQQMLALNVPALSLLCTASPVRHNSNRAAVTRINRKFYPQMYPTLLVFADGSTVNIRYKEPRSIIKLPIDLSSLTEKERAERIAKRKPKRKAVKEEEIEDSFDVNQYSHLWKNRK